MTRHVIVAVGVAALLAMSSAAALADSRQRGQGAYDTRDPDSYDYNVPPGASALRLRAVLLGLWRSALLRQVRELQEIWARARRA